MTYPIELSGAGRDMAGLGEARKPAQMSKNGDKPSKPINDQPVPPKVPTKPIVPPPPKPKGKQI